jgi:hypothetical protein
MDNADTKPVKEHEKGNKKQEKLPDDIITIRRGDLEVSGMRKHQEYLIQQLLDLEKANE